ncbi:MAG TPA: hypothetical protein VHR66_27210 [Gemmataceae bacterium]|jgi:hypothetical protein|nr:hypothetical protein [Gemmataceae bacterium]
MEDVGLASGLIALALLAGAGAIVIQVSSGDPGSKVFQTRLFFAALMLRFAASLAIYQFGFINTIKDEDGSGWVAGMVYNQAWEQQGRTVTDLPAMVVDAYETKNKGYYHLLGWFFFVTGLQGRLAAAALNCSFGAMTVVLTYRTARLLLTIRGASWAGWCSCLFPSLILWSAQTVKEPVVIFLESVVLYATLRLRMSLLNPKYLFLCGGAIILLMPFRFYAAYVSVIAVLLGLLAGGSRAGRIPGVFAAGLLAAVLIAAFGGFLQKERSADYMDLKYIESFRRNSAIGEGSGSAAYIEADLSSSVGFGLAMAFGGVHLLFAPFPWQWTSLRAMLVAPETIFWWWLCWRYVGPGLWYASRKRLADFAPLLLFVVLMALLYSVMFSNVGLAYRQRAQLLPWLFVLGGLGRERHLCRMASPRRLIMTPGGIPRAKSVAGIV